MDFLGSYYLIRTLLRAAETALHDFSPFTNHITSPEKKGVPSMER